jgi:hypothetical protein
MPWWIKRILLGVPFNPVSDMIQHSWTTHFMIFSIAVMSCIVGSGFGVIWGKIGEHDFSTFHDLS